MKHFKGDIVHYTVTLLVETSNILLPTHNIWTLVSRSHLIDYNAAQNLGSKTDFPDLTVVDLHQKKIIKVQLVAQQPYEDVRITFFR